MAPYIPLKVGPRLRQCRQATLAICFCFFSPPVSSPHQVERWSWFYRRGFKFQKAYFGASAFDSSFLGQQPTPTEQRWSDWLYDCGLNKCIYRFCPCQSLLMLKRETRDWPGRPYPLRVASRWDSTARAQRICSYCELRVEDLSRTLGSVRPRVAEWCLLAQLNCFSKHDNS